MSSFAIVPFTDVRYSSLEVSTAERRLAVYAEGCSQLLCSQLSCTPCAFFGATKPASNLARAQVVTLVDSITAVDDMFDLLMISLLY